MTVSDVGRSAITRIRCVYDLAPRLQLKPAVPLTDVLNFGRFQGHLDASARLLPQVAHTDSLHQSRMSVSSDVTPASDVTLLVLTTPRQDALLLLDIPLPKHTTVSDVVRLLATSCWDRHQIKVDGQPILEWLSNELSISGSISFGRNVHQCVLPGGRLRETLLAADHDPPAPSLTSIIYRGTLSSNRGGRLGIRIPESLRNPAETLVAHGRGVSLITGWNASVENVLTLTAVTIVSALGVLHRARDIAFEALTLNQDSQLRSTTDARELVSRLSDSLNEIQLDLSFGVEVYVDGILVPELVVDGFQSSLRDASGLDSGLVNTSRMVERLGTVIRARAAMLDAATQEERDRKSRVFSVLIAVGSLIALPPSLLLAFFGVTSPDVDQTTSILNVGRYWVAYTLAWLPFAALLVLGFVFRRRIRNDARLFRTRQQAPRGSPTNGGVRVPRQSADSVASAMLEAGSQ